MIWGPLFFGNIHIAIYQKSSASSLSCWPHLGLPYGEAAASECAPLAIVKVTTLGTVCPSRAKRWKVKVRPNPYCWHVRMDIIVAQLNPIWINMNLSFQLPSKGSKGVISVQNELHQGYDVFTITKRFWCNKNGSHKKNKVYYITPWKFTTWILKLLVWKR